jgi:hypothetical protein
MADRCGRCKGTGEHKEPRGVRMVTCEPCEGTGSKVRKEALGKKRAAVQSRRTDSPYDCAKHPKGMCALCPPDKPRRAAHRHHVTPFQRIQDLLPEGMVQVQALRDVRNLVDMCWPCHADVENAHPDALRKLAAVLHDEFSDFIDEFDLEAGLPRYLTKGVV